MERPKRRIKPMLENLEKLWLSNPDLRLGQLLFVLAKTEDLYNMEDYDMLKRILEEQSQDNAVH